MYVVYACEYAGVCPCTCASRGQKRTLEFFLYCSSLHCFETRSLTEPEPLTFRIHLSLSSRLRSQACAAMLGFI